MSISLFVLFRSVFFPQFSLELHDNEIPDLINIWDHTNGFEERERERERERFRETRDRREGEIQRERNESQEERVREKISRLSVYPDYQYIRNKFGQLMAEILKSKLAVSQHNDIDENSPKRPQGSQLFCTNVNVMTI